MEGSILKGNVKLGDINCERNKTDYNDVQIFSYRVRDTGLHDSNLRVGGVCVRQIGICLITRKDLESEGWTFYFNCSL